MTPAKLIALLALVASSCGTPLLPAAGVCEQDSDCEKGLQCLSFGISSNGTCAASQSKVCTVPCTTDSDCASLKSPSGSGTFTCFSCPPVQSTCGLRAQ